MSALLDRWSDDVLRRRGRLIAVAVIVVSVATALVYPATGNATIMWRDWVVHNLVGAILLGGILFPLAQERPRNAAVWIIGLAAVFSAVQVATNAATLAAEILQTGSVVGDVPPADLPLVTAVLAWASAWTWVPVVVPVFTLLPLYFPDGQLPSGRWRSFAWAGWAGVALLSAAFAAMTFPTSTHRLTEAFELPYVLVPLLAGYGTVLVAIVAGVAALVVKTRRAHGHVQAQIRVLAFGMTVGGVLVVASYVADPIGEVFRLTAIPAITVIFGAILVALLRYRLYDVDVVISRSVTFALLAAFITGIYVAIVVGIGSLVGRGDEPNLALSVVATAVVAVAFQPARERVQHWANRLVFGRRATPYEVLTGLARTSADDPPGNVLARIAELVVAGTNARSATVRVRVGDELRPEATHPPTLDPYTLDIDEVGDDTDGASGSDQRLVRHEGEVLGMLEVQPDRGQPLTPADGDLVEDVAEALGLVLRNVRLTAELRDRVEKLQHSRQRILAAQDEARRKIERDIHDGPQQNLSALQVRLTVAQRDAARADADQLRTLLAQAETDTTRAISTLRELARGVYPPLLQAEGLAAALKAQAAKLPLAVTVHAPKLARLPADIEAAVYFTALEALNNTVKYAEATSAHVTIRHEHDTLHFAITDDGTGFDPDTADHGTGLANIRDRIDSVNGTIAVDSEPGRGTAIRGEVPLASRQRGATRPASAS